MGTKIERSEERNGLLVSVKPRFAATVLDGTRTVDLRRVAPKVAPGTRVLLYASAPRKCLVGEALVESIHTGFVADLWREFSEQAGLDLGEFEAYFEGLRVGTAIRLATVVRYEPVIPLDRLTARWPGFRPPRSYRYLSQAEISRLLWGER